MHFCPLRPISSEHRKKSAPRLFVNPAFNGPANPLSNFSESLQILSPRHHWFLAGPGLRGESILSYPILLPLTRVESPQIDYEQFSSPSTSNPPLGSRFVFHLPY